MAKMLEGQERETRETLGDTAIHRETEKHKKTWTDRERETERHREA